ncbi:hypothetical protein [Nonomuraea longispora]|uniref:hypothetical protein n=1 Tax=Nonomuraea longispora TaxID=1848320 RepID=UPI0014053BD9|nr:hypothetical protein [Nonomuraea longispora]
MVKTILGRTAVKTSAPQECDCEPGEKLISRGSSPVGGQQDERGLFGGLARAPTAS